MSSSIATATLTMATTSVRIPVPGRTWLDADITTPAEAHGVVLFASGSSRRSPRNRYVACDLNYRRFATVLVDLLTLDEEREEHRRFDIPMLTERVVTVIDRLGESATLAGLPLGLLGASTGAAAAFDAATMRAGVVRAVVSRGGRPDLASNLERVLAPALLIVGGNDAMVLAWNRAAMRRLACTKELKVVPGATHLFDEAGALEAVASAAGAWFEQFAGAAMAGGLS